MASETALPTLPGRGSEVLIDDAVLELQAINYELERRKYIKQPDLWVTDRLQETIWSAQKRIMLSVAQNRRTAVKTCHSIGKSFSAARVSGWFLDTRRVSKAFVVTSAPSGPQVRNILWREIGRVHARAGLRGRVNQTEWFMTADAGNEEIVAFGRKPDDMDMTAFQGIHAPEVLFIFDEACGMPTPLWEAADSLISNDRGKALAIGNPDDPTSEFERICRPGSGWNVIEVGAFDTPNFTGEKLPSLITDQLIGRVYVEEKRKRWAPTWFWVDRNGQPCDAAVGVRVVPPEGADPQDTNPLWQSKVLGKFPKVGDEFGLIPMSWIERAKAREYEDVDDESVLGVDVGGGGDSSTICHRRGRRYRIVSEDRNPDTMQTCGNVLAWLGRLRAVRAMIDMIGIGRGVVDRAKEQRQPVYGVTVSEAPIKLEKKKQEEEDESFHNYRSQLWWYVRQAFEQDEVDLDELDEDLHGQLASIRFKRDSSNAIQIESKIEAKRRGIPSPNRAEALMLSRAKPRKTLGKATWGR